MRPSVSAWQVPAFRRYWSGQFISSVGDRITPVALAFSVLKHFGSARDLGLVLAAPTVTYVLVLLIGGVWADRLPVRSVMVIADLARFAAQAGSGALILFGGGNVVWLVILQGCYGTAQAFFDPASTAMIPATVPSESVQSANAFMAIQRNAALIVGPSLAGVLVVTVGGGWGLEVDALTFAFNVVTLRGLPNQSRQRANASTFFQELAHGWRTFTGRAWLWSSVAFFSTFVGFVIGPLQVLGPLQSVHRLAGVASWAVIAGGQGAGAILGGITALRLRPRRPLVAGFIGLLVTWPIFLVTLSITTVTAVITAAACGAGFALSLFGTLWATVLQRHVPRDVLSRVSAYDWLGSKAMSPVGVVLAGFLGSSMNVSAMLLFIAAWCGLSTVCSLVFGGGARLISSPLPAPYQQTA